MLPKETYFAQAIFDEEMQRLFTSGYQFVGLTDDLANHRDFVCLDHAGAGQVCLAQICALQLGLPHAGAGQVCLAQICALQPRLLHARSLQLRPTQVRISQLRLAQVSACVVFLR